MTAAVLILAGLVGFGALAGALGVFRDSEAAAEVLNRFAITLAFPVWIVVLLLKEEQTDSAAPALLSAAAVWLVWLPFAWAASRFFRDAAHRTAAFCALIYGNSAYIGIPFCTALAGSAGSRRAVGIATLHLLLGMAVMPVLLRRASPQASNRSVLAETLRMPIVWAPWIGIAARYLPASIKLQAVAMLSPLGAAASPVALLAMGLYLWRHRAAVVAPDRGIVGATVLKTAGAGLLALAVVHAMPISLTDIDRAVVVAQATTPVGVAVFSLCHAYGVAELFAARAVVVSTLVWLVGAMAWGLTSWAHAG